MDHNGFNTAEVLKSTQLYGHALLEMPTSSDSTTKRVTDSSPAIVTHTKLRGKQGGTGQDGHIHLADWTLSVVFWLPADIVRQNVWPTSTHQTLRQQGGTGEDGYIHLGDCMDSQCSIVSTCRYSTTKCMANNYTPNSMAAWRNWNRSTPTFILQTGLSM